jgi:hypothetical protein
MAQKCVAGVVFSEAVMEAKVMELRSSLGCLAPQLAFSIISDQLTGSVNAVSKCCLEMKKEGRS